MPVRMKEIEITVMVYPTEVEERVRTAVLNLFPDAEIETMESGLSAKASSLEVFSTKLRDQRIRDTARSVLHRLKSGDSINFTLNKQAAFVGKVNFTEGDSLLGDLEVKIPTDEPDALIDRLITIEEEEEI